MTFLNSSFLWFLPAAGLPVLIHFIFLNRSRNISFSSIFLLRQVYLKNLPRSRIEQWILLALRCFALAVLILAFCRPVIYSSLAGRIFTGSMSGPALKIVMLADVSYSMRCRSQGEERYKLAVQAASADMSWKAIDRYSRDYIEIQEKQGVKFWKTPDAILRAQLAAWDKIMAAKSAENPAFKKVNDSMRDFAKRACRWQNDTLVDYKMAYNHFFARKG